MQARLNPYQAAPDAMKSIMGLELATINVQNRIAISFRINPSGEGGAYGSLKLKAGGSE